MRDLIFALVMGGNPVFLNKKTKKIAAVKNRKKMRQNGVKLKRATLVATNDNPQKITAVARAI